MYDAVITLFNYRKSEHAWYTTVFHGANLIEPRGNSATQQGQVNADTVEIIIHVKPNQDADTLIYVPNNITDVDGNVLTSDNGVHVAYDDPETHESRQYISPKAYAHLEAVDGRFTFTPETDFVVVGNYSSQEPIDDDEYEDGLYQAMNEAQDGVYMITSATYFSLLPHFEIGGR